MKQSGSEIRALFSKAGVGQDGTDIHIALPTEAEATTVFEHICEIGDGYAEYGLMKPRWRWDWKLNWWWRSTETTFEVWDPTRPTPIIAFRPWAELGKTT